MARYIGKIDIHSDATIIIKCNNRIEPSLFNISNIRQINDVIIRQNILNNADSQHDLMFSFSWTCRCTDNLSLIDMFIKKINFTKTEYDTTKSHLNYTICWSINNLIEHANKNEINNSHRILEHLYEIAPHLVIKCLITQIRFSRIVNLTGKISEMYEKLKLLSYDEQVDIMIKEFLKIDASEIDLSNMEISKLPKLSNNLQILTCSNNPINVIDNLPKNLKILDCNGCKIEYIRSLPDLIYLDCSSNHLKEINNLPDTLETFCCGFNGLENIPPLPDSLVHFQCEENNITKLPRLPKNLKTLYCFGNTIDEIEKILPDKLEILDCDPEAIKNSSIIPANVLVNL